MDMANILLVFYFLVFLVSTSFLGALTCSVLKIKFEDKTQSYFFHFGVGSILFSYIFHVLGVLGILFSSVVAFVYFFISILWIFQTGFLLNPSKKLVGLLKVIQMKAAHIDSVTVGIYCLLFFFIFPLIPYLFLYPQSWDVLAYHVLLPKVYLSQHSLSFISWFDQTGFPIGIEALFGFGEAVKESRLANFIHFSYLVGTVLFLLHGIRNLVTKGESIVAMFLFLVNPLLYSEISISAFVDFPLAFFTLLSFVSIEKFFKSEVNADFYLMMILLGFLPLIKFSGFIILLSVVVTTIILKRNFFTSLSVQKVTAIIASNLVILYWCIRNFISTKNPFYPFYNDVFKGYGYQEGMKQLMKDDILSNSFLMEMMHRFKSSQDGPQDYVHLSAVLFIFLGLFSFFWYFLHRKKGVSAFTLMVGLSLLIILVLIGPLTRYVLFLFPVIAVLVAKLVGDAKRSVPSFLYTALVLGFFFIQVDSTFVTRSKLFIDSPKRTWFAPFFHTKDVAFLQNQDIVPIQQFANQYVSNDSKVLQLLDNRLYYLDVPSAFANTVGGGYFTDKKTLTGEDAYKRIVADGYSYVIKQDLAEAHESMNKQVFIDFMASYTTPVATRSGFTLYSIGSR